MFTKKCQLTFESNTIDVMRKYAPYFLIVMAAVGTVVSLYYLSFRGSHETLDELGDAAADSVDANTRIARESVGEVYLEVVP